ncbi:MAG: type II secretion system GspH family protein [Phycisphaeraceae bacterium]|nr:type II secretion system GspH family protein [Phycisphaeraceae bacterium]
MSRRLTKRSAVCRGGFTLVEALASLMLVAVVLPFVIRGVTMSARNAAESDQRADAAMLAQTMLEEAVLAGAWQTGDAEGTFDEMYGKDATRYTWALSIADWQSTDYRELTMTVRWMRGKKEKTVAVSTVVNADE